MKRTYDLRKSERKRKVTQNLRKTYEMLVKRCPGLYEGPQLLEMFKTWEGGKKEFIGESLLISSYSLMHYV